MKETKTVDTVAKVQEAKLPEAEKAAATITEEKKAPKTPASKPAAKKTAASKTAKTSKTTKTTVKTAKTAAPKKTAAIVSKVVIELADKSASSEALIERAKDDWTNKGNDIADIKELALYVNASEGMVYYVVNDDYLSGSFAF